MARRNYKFTSKKQSGKGIAASILGVLSWIILVVTVQMSFEKGGNGSVYLGSAGLAAMFLALGALCLAVSGFRGDRTFKLFAGIGTLISLLALLVWIAIYVVGFLL